MIANQDEYGRSCGCPQGHLLNGLVHSPYEAKP